MRRSCFRLAGLDHDGGRDGGRGGLRAARPIAAPGFVAVEFGRRPAEHSPKASSVLLGVLVLRDPAAADRDREGSPLLNAVDPARRPLRGVCGVREEQVRVDGERIGLRPEDIVIRVVLGAGLRVRNRVDDHRRAAGGRLIVPAVGRIEALERPVLGRPVPMGTRRGTGQTRCGSSLRIKFSGLQTSEM